MFAGKAHPADDLGKEMIAEIVRFSRDPAVRHRITFIEDYDISVARIMYQGSDVWLNTPRRPMEASGTSGEKAALNGALNCSILDGWWDEMFDGTQRLGHLLGRGHHRPRPSRRGRGQQPLRAAGAADHPAVLRPWRRALPPRLGHAGSRRRCDRSGPKVMASRMVRDYLDEMYEPIAAQSDALAGDGYARARALAAWKQRVTAAWPEVKVEVDPDPGVGFVDLGADWEVTAEVHLGSLTPDDVAVELLHGPVAAGDELTDTRVVRLESVEGGGGRWRWRWRWRWRGYRGWRGRG